MSNILNNTTSLREVLNTINSLPEASGGVELPELTNPGVAADLLINKELIDGDGNIVTGTMPNNGTITKTIDGINTKEFILPPGYISGGSVSLDNTIDDEVNEQTDLIAQIKSAVDNLPETGESGSSVAPILYGTYMLTENPELLNKTSISLSLEGKGAKAYFYNGQTYQYLPITKAEIGTSTFEFEANMTDVDSTNYLLYVNNGGWSYAYVKFGSSPETSEGSLPDAKGRIIVFTLPVEVDQDFYAAFLSCVDNSSDTPYEIGVKTQYDEFWDSYQANGNRTDYEYAFAGQGWTDETFKPKYDIVPVSATHIFSNTGITDIIGCLKNAGVSLDFSKCTSTSYIMQAGKYATNFPTVDLRKRAHCNYLFYSCSKLHTIEKIILKDDGSQSFADYSFGYDTELVEIRFEGVIGKNGLNLKWSTKLSKESIKSIINALSTTTSGLSVTLSSTAVNKAFETSAEENNGSTSAEWTALVATKSNWTISLV